MIDLPRIHLSLKFDINYLLSYHIMTNNRPFMVSFEITVSNHVTNLEIPFVSNIESSQEDYNFIIIQAEGMLSASSCVANGSGNDNYMLKVVNDEQNKVLKSVKI